MKKAVCVLAASAILSAALPLPLGACRRAAPAPVCAGARTLSPAEQRHRAFLAGCGVTAAETPPLVRPVALPAAPDRVFGAYNALQKAQGFDLSPYLGRTVLLFTYELIGYPGVSSEDRVVADLYESGGKVIGGDICSVRADGGFLIGFHGETNENDTA